MSEDVKRKEDRELQIKLAQLHARLQVSLAWAIGLSAFAITFFVFGFQFDKQNLTVSVIAWIGGFVLFGLVFLRVHRVKKIEKEFENLQ